jgi:hypothetical protein
LQVLNGLCSNRLCSLNTGGGDKEERQQAAEGKRVGFSFAFWIAYT